MLEQAITDLTVQVAKLNRLMVLLVADTADAANPPKRARKVKQEPVVEQQAPEPTPVPEPTPAPKEPGPALADHLAIKQAAMRLAALKGKQHVMDLMRKEIGVNSLADIPDDRQAEALRLLSDELAAHELLRAA